MATSTNFGWTEPDDTDLVKDGASAMRTLGNAIDSTVWTVAGYAAGKNKIINGDFGINQRSFSSTTTTSTYGFDRWKLDYTGGTATYSAQTFTAGAAPVTGYESANFARLVTSSQSASSNYAGLVQGVEDVRNFANQTVTVSFWAKASTGTPKVQPTLEQIFGSGGSASVPTAGTAVTISTSWARYSATVSVPSISGKTIGTNNYLKLVLFTSLGTDYPTYGNIGLQNATIDIWGVQLEAGSTATPFQTATGTIQGELAACQRYYFRYGGSSAYESLGYGNAASTTNAYIDIKTPVTLRQGTSLTVDYSTLALADGINTPSAATAVSMIAASKDVTRLTVDVASGLTQYRWYRLITNNSTSGYIGLSAEL